MKRITKYTVIVREGVSLFLNELNIPARCLEGMPALGSVVGVRYYKEKENEQVGSYSVLSEPWPDGDLISEAVRDLFRNLLCEGEV